MNQPSSYMLVFPGEDNSVVDFQEFTKKELLDHIGELVTHNSWIDIEREIRGMNKPGDWTEGNYGEYFGLIFRIN